MNHHPSFLFALIVIFLFTLFFIGRHVCIEGSTVIVTGAAQGLGMHIAQIMLDKKCKQIHLVDINEAKLRDSFPAEYVRTRIHFHICDVSDEKKVRNMMKDIFEISHNVDILVNNAAIVVGKEFMFNESIRRTFEVNTLGACWMMKAVLPSFCLGDSVHHIVNVASSIGNSYSCDLSDYAASKAALIAMHNSIRLELQRERSLSFRKSTINMTLVLPWIMDTTMFNGVELPGLINMLFPVLNTQKAASKIVESVEHNDEEVHLPYLLSWMVALLFLFPPWLRDFFVSKSGGGRPNKKKIGL